MNYNQLLSKQNKQNSNNSCRRRQQQQQQPFPNPNNYLATIFCMKWQGVFFLYKKTTTKHIQFVHILDTNRMRE